MQWNLTNTHVDLYGTLNVRRLMQNGTVISSKFIEVRAGRRVLAQCQQYIPRRIHPGVSFVRTADFVGD